MRQESRVGLFTATVLQRAVIGDVGRGTGDSGDQRYCRRGYLKRPWAISSQTEALKDRVVVVAVDIEILHQANRIFLEEGERLNALLYPFVRFVRGTDQVLFRCRSPVVFVVTLLSSGRVASGTRADHRAVLCEHPSVL